MVGYMEFDCDWNVEYSPQVKRTLIRLRKEQPKIYVAA
jgi:hypothetical protein